MIIFLLKLIFVCFISVNGLPISDHIDGYSDSKLDTDAEALAAELFTDNGYVADGFQREKPTARIRVTVVRRSRRYWEPWELNNNICPPSICTANDERPRPRGTDILELSSVHVTGGSVFYNGDIVLDNESEKIIYGNSFRMRYKRATMRSSRTWRNATIPYMFADDIAPKSKSVLKKAMKRIESLTCIRFRRRKLRDVDYVRYISEPGCWSSVGRVGGEQKLSIGMGCERIGTAIHEISHVLGFWHEQARPDRDKYVKILEENISPRYLPDFNVANKTLVTSRGFPYDYESVMHYSKKAFTNIGEDTIKVIGIGKKLKMHIGQRDALSTIDIGQLRDMYKCTDKKDEEETYCPDGWKKFTRWCYKFESEKVEQFAGALKHCDSMNSRLLFINDQTEDTNIKRYIKKKFPDVKIWRTGARVVNGSFVWYTEKDTHKMEYEHWKKGHPGSYSSMALVYNKKKNRVRWEGVWLGSYTQMPDHAYPFICERRARRKCITGSYKDGRDYRGKLDHTVDGFTCQKWSSQYPWSHKLLPYPYEGTKDDEDGLGDHNYCRNPSGDRKSRPWCYTTKSKYKWQYCDISICSKSIAEKKNDESNKIPSDNKATSSNGGKKSDRNTNETNKNSNNKKGDSNRQQNEITYINDSSSGKQRQQSDKSTNRRNKNRKDKTGRNDKNSDKKSREKKNRRG
ncbi:hypothetical protein ACF0H5_007526 [Mactra antiquata]